MELNITFRNDISEISRLEGFIEQVAEQFSLPMDIVFNLNLVLEEAVANASSAIDAIGKTPPIYGEDGVFLVWRRKDCCQGKNLTEMGLGGLQ